MKALEQQEFGTSAGFSPRLTALAHTRVEGLWLTNVALSGSQGEMRLAGESLFAALVPEYLQALSLEPAMAGAAFASLEMERLTETNRITFNVSSRDLLEGARSGQFASAAP